MATNLPDLSLGVGARSEKGRREENQDKMTAFPTSLGTVYIVADGMGGHRGGAEASHLVIEGYRKHLTSFQEGAGLPDVLQAATVLTNAEILEAGHSGDPAVAGMGSTVVMAVLRTGANGMEMLTGHIGDSRAYLLRSGSLHRLTRDHSAVQRMVDAQILTPEAARSHPDSNVLTRALGQQPNVVIDVSMPEPLLPGDTLLLCSDGLWGYVPDEQLQHELSLDRSASEAADALADLALEQGSDDNITLQVLRLEDRQRTMRAPEVLRQTEVDGLALAAVAAPGGNSAGKRAKLWSRSERNAPAWSESRIAPPEPKPGKTGTLIAYAVVLVLGLAIGALSWFLIQHHKPHPKPGPPPVAGPHKPNQPPPNTAPGTPAARPGPAPRQTGNPPPPRGGSATRGNQHPGKNPKADQFHVVLGKDPTIGIPDGPPPPPPHIP